MSRPAFACDLPAGRCNLGAAAVVLRGVHVRGGEVCRRGQDGDARPEFRWLLVDRDA